MANTRSAKKRIRQSEKRRLRNRAVRTRVRTETKKVLRAVAAGDRETAAQAYVQAQSVIDRAVKRGVLHWRTAARRKSRLARRVNQLAAGSGA
jgi:small subunit ribosomal protein S20